ncbi:hypothetical protein sos41_23100 [Alphaproteobacteria bacterium SO-S41]|nr:hypothetical protein sos41_23100 [Alphaproteobacteria bacterium SO-S41]
MRICSAMLVAATVFFASPVVAREQKQSDVPDIKACQVLTANTLAVPGARILGYTFDPDKEGASDKFTFASECRYLVKTATEALLEITVRLSQYESVEAAKAGFQSAMKKTIDDGDKVTPLEGIADEGYSVDHPPHLAIAARSGDRRVMMWSRDDEFKPVMEVLVMLAFVAWPAEH